MSLINDALKRAKQIQAKQVPAVVTAEALQPVVAPHSPVHRPPVAWMAASGVLLLLAVVFISLWWRHSGTPSTIAQANSRRSVQSQPAPQTASHPAPQTQAAPHSPLPTQTLPTTTQTISPAAAKSESPSSPTAALAVPTATAVTPAAQMNSTVSAKPVAPAPTPTPSVASEKPTLAGAANVVPGTAPATEPPSDQLFPNANAAPIPPEVLAAKFRLQGIFYRMKRASVLINGATLFIGDEIEGAKVISIDRHAVGLLIDGRTNLVKLH